MNILTRIASTFVLAIVSNLCQAELFSASASYIAPKSMLTEDAYNITRNRALIDVSEQACLFVDAQKRLSLMNGNKQSMQDIRVTAAVVTKIVSEHKSHIEIDGNSISYQVDLVVDVDESKQRNLISLMSENTSVNDVLFELSEKQQELFRLINHDKTNQQGLSAINQRVETAITTYERKLEQTSSWIDHALSDAARNKIRAVTLMQDADKKIAKLQEDTVLNPKDQQSREQEQRSVINKIQQIIKSGMPPEITQFDVLAHGKENLRVKFIVNWKLGYRDIDKICSLALTSELAERCIPSSDGKYIDLLNASQSRPVLTSKELWQQLILNSSLSGLLRSESPKTYVLLSYQHIRMNIAGEIIVVDSFPTSQLEVAINNPNSLNQLSWR
jgi:hypothetical protein